MTRLIKYICAISFIAMFAGCNNDREVLGRLEQIKTAGDSDPREALKMLDSLTTQIKDESEYVRMKYDLLNLRLHDKAYDIPSSDSIARTVLEYFDKNGDNLEQQEANYYAASVYRDLKDTPRALEYFYKSVDLANDGDECDSIVLRNAYSWLSYLLWTVQDYYRSNDYAKKEYEIAKAIDKVTINSLMHLGVTYQYLDSMDMAKEWLDKAYNKLLESDPVTDAETIYYLIHNYSRIMDYKQATACYELTKKLPENHKPNYLNLGSYFVMINQPDSAILCYKHVMDDNNDLFTIFDTSKNLFSVYYKLGKYKEAAYYANIFRHASDTLDLGRRQELAATINNQYQYHLDKNREMQLVADKEKSRTWLVAVSAGALLLLSSLILLMMHRKNRHLRRTLMLSNELEEMKTSQDKLLEKISVKEKELKSSRKAYDNTKEELESVRERLQEVSDEVEVQKSELKNKEKELADKIEQNKSLFSLIHRAEFEKNAAEIVSKVQMSAEGVKNMTPSDWNELYVAIDTMYPDFKSILLDKLGIISRRDMMITYLMRIGLSNRQIMNMTNIPRTSLYRQIKDLQWVRTLDGSSIIHQSKNKHKHTTSPKTSSPRKRRKKD